MKEMRSGEGYGDWNYVIGVPLGFPLSLEIVGSGVWESTCPIVQDFLSAGFLPRSGLLPVEFRRVLSLLPTLGVSLPSGVRLVVLPCFL